MPPLVSPVIRVAILGMTVNRNTLFLDPSRGRLCFGPWRPTAVGIEELCLGNIRSAYAIVCWVLFPRTRTRFFYHVL